MNKALIAFLFKWALTLVLLGGGLIYLDTGRVAAAIERIGWGAFATVVALSVLGSIVLPAFGTRMALFHGRIVITLKELVVINMCMRFYTLVLPRALSIAIRWQRYRARGDAANVTALMVFERLVQLLVYVGAALLFFVIDPIPKPGEGIPLWPLIMLGLLLLPLLWLFLARRGGNPEEDADDASWLQRQTRRLWMAIRVYRDLDRKDLLKIVSLYLTHYLLVVTQGWVVVQSMGLPLDWMQLAWIRPVIFLLTLFPLSIGGMGVRELGFVGLLALYGIDSESAFALGLSMSAVQIVIGLAGAGFELRYWFTRRGLRHVEDQEK